MTKPLVSHPHNGDTWSHTLLIVQGFYPDPAKGNLEVYVNDSKGNKVEGEYVPSYGTLFVFAFKKLDPEDYVLHVKETAGSDGSDPVHFRIKGSFGVAILWPSDGSSVSQTFAAWGTSDTDLDTTVDQTMTGNNGGGAVTPGTITMQPSDSGSNYWVVQFGITDNPFQNGYELDIQATPTPTPTPTPPPTATASSITVVANP
jgi:hypothetical protein